MHISPQGNGNTFHGNTRREISLHPYGWREISDGVKIYEIFNPIVHAPYGNPEDKTKKKKFPGNGNTCNGTHVSLAPSQWNFSFIPTLGMFLRL